MRNYTERLRAPAAWWVLGEVSAIIFASTAWAGFSLVVAIASYVVCCGGCAAVLLSWGHATIEVSDGELRSGSVTLPLALAGEVAAPDAPQATGMRRRRADPSAFILIGPDLRRAVS